MANHKKLRVIEVLWKGSYSEKDIKKFNEPKDCGLYQIYGPHEVHGPCSLLYIGKTSDQTFARRIVQHTWLFDKDGMNALGDLQIYVGRLGGMPDVTSREWGELIDVAERLLIYYSNPLYNTVGHEYQSVKDIHNTAVVNLGKKNALPIEVSTLPDESKAWVSDDRLGESIDWKFYEGKGKI